MTARRILVLGGGFAGLWAAASAARFLDRHGPGPHAASIALVNRDGWHSIRVRNYEPDLADVRVPLDDVLGPIGVERIEADVLRIDAGRAQVHVRTAQGAIAALGYDRLVVALGSVLARPPLPGLAEHAFDVDTTVAALRLDAHLKSRKTWPADAPGRGTLAVVGAGLTGIEVAMEMPARLRTALGNAAAARVVLVDHRPRPGSDLGDAARPHILRALASQGIEVRCDASVTAIDVDALRLADGTSIAARTVVWCAGMRANPLAAGLLPDVELDRHGRLPVDATLRVKRRPAVFAAGDIATFPIDGIHASVMSCQHARPMGRYAGWNAAADLFGEALLPLHVERYVTVLDLGACGALYLEGWERRVAAVGAEAKRTKETINRVRIVPPLTRDRDAILDAAAPVVQAPPRR